MKTICPPDAPCTHRWNPAAAAWTDVRTTAAAWADQLAPMRVYLTGARIHPLDLALVAMYRAAAADEGSLYAEAIRGARALRSAAVARKYNHNFHPPHSVFLNVPDPAVHLGERARGIPSWDAGTR